MNILCTRNCTILQALSNETFTISILGYGHLWGSWFCLSQLPSFVFLIRRPGEIIYINKKVEESDLNTDFPFLKPILLTTDFSHIFYGSVSSFSISVLFISYYFNNTMSMHIQVIYSLWFVLAPHQKIKTIRIKVQRRKRLWILVGFSANMVYDLNTWFHDILCVLQTFLLIFRFSSIWENPWCEALSDVVPRMM